MDKEKELAKINENINDVYVVISKIMNSNDSCADKVIGVYSYVLLLNMLGFGKTLIDYIRIKGGD